MLERIRRLRKGFTLPIWMAFIWSASSTLGNAFRIENAMSRLWNFVNTTSGGRILLIVCVLLLILVATWPELKAWCFRQIGYIPAPKPPPIDERMTRVETQLAPMVEQLSGIPFSLSAMNAHIARVEFEMQKRDPLIAMEFGQLKSSVDIIASKVPQCIAFLSDFGDLLWEADKCIETYMDFRNAYHMSVPAKEPFSKWRPVANADNITEDIREGEKWAVSLEHHIEHARAFFMSHDMAGMDSEDLFKFVTNWRAQRHDYSGERLVKLMQDYRRNLGIAKKAYAAKFATVELLRLA